MHNVFFRGRTIAPFLRASLAAILTAALCASPALASSVHRAPTSGHAAGHGAHKGKAARGKRQRGQQAIDSARATEIQQALINKHYLSGEPSGKWDSSTVAAMQKLQADQGWQTKLTPDSRALKMLGLGPDYSKAINAREASFGAPPPASTIPADQAAGFSAAAGVSR